MTEEIKDIQDTAKAYIQVFKSERRLELFHGEDCIGKFPVGLGFCPVGRKQKTGDGKTPEGTYYICTRNPDSKFYLSLGISYPNHQDAEEAYEQGSITLEQFEQMTQANINGVRPPWDTPLGGEIMIHGHGSSKDWTAGCIAVEDDVMDIIWRYCSLGAEIIIRA